jgi:hypothetical protein
MQYSYHENAYVLWLFVFAPAVADFDIVGISSILWVSHPGELLQPVGDAGAVHGAYIEHGFAYMTG